MFDRGLEFIRRAVSYGRGAHGHSAAGDALEPPPPNAVAEPALEPRHLHVAQLVDRTAAWEMAQRALVAAQLIDIAAFDSAQRAADRRVPGVGNRLIGRTVAPQVALLLGVSTSAGASRVALARTVVDEHPALLHAAEDGLLGEWHLRAVCAATSELTPEQKQVVARQLAVQVRARDSRGVKQLTPPELARAATRLVIAIDPEAAARRYQAARRTRQVSVTGRVDGTAALWVKGPAEQAQHMYDEVHRDAVTRRHDGDERPLETIMFEQIYESVLAGTQGGPDEVPDSTRGPSGDRPQPRGPGAEPGLAPGDLDPDDPAHDGCCDDRAPLPIPPARHHPRRQRRVEAHVVMSASTLLGLDEQPALLRGYGAVPAEIARQIADTSTGDDPSRIAVRRLFCDPVDGRLVTMESSARLFTGPLRQFALFRDQACRLSGGRIRDIDHLRESARGGGTTASNAQALSKGAHVLRDHPGVRAGPWVGAGRGRAPDGDPLADLRAHSPDVRWRFPTGHTAVSEPPPALGHGSDPVPDSVGELELTLVLQRHANGR